MRSLRLSGLGIACACTLALALATPLAIHADEGDQVEPPEQVEQTVAADQAPEDAESPVDAGTADEQQPADADQPADAAEPTDEQQPADDAEGSDGQQSVDTDQPSDDAEVADDQPADADQPADDTETTDPQQPVEPERGFPQLTEAKAAYVMNVDGTVLYDLNGELELPMASITKVMTAMVALDSGIPLDEPIGIIVDGYPADSQLAGYVEGDAPTFGDLLRATLVYSANDAAANVAYAVAGSKEAFADLMNAKAAELGLTHTHFMNPHGLEEEGHYSCARDLVVMGRYATQHYPFIRNTVRMRSVDLVVDGKVVTFHSTDDLMDAYSGVRGIKTGNTQSGTSFLSYVTNNNVTIYTCVLCCPTKEGRFNDTRILLDWALEGYPMSTLAKSDWVREVAPWQDGFWASCPVGSRHDVEARVALQGGELEEHTVSYGMGSRVQPGMTFGTTLWTQDGRYVAGTSYGTAATPKQVSAWNPFVLPLFTDVKELLH